MHCEAEASTRYALASSYALLATDRFRATIEQGRLRLRPTGGAANRPGFRPSMAALAILCRGTAFRITDVHARRLHNRRTKRLRSRRLERHDEDQIKRWLEFAAQCRPDVGDRTLLSERPTDRQEHFSLTSSERARENLVRKRVDLEKSHEDTAQEAVLVFGPLRPRRDQVRAVVPTGSERTARHQTVCTATVFQERLSSVKVLADVVEEHVEGGAVASSGPVPGRSVEHNLDVVRDLRPGAKKGAYGVVHILQHPTILRGRTAQRAYPGATVRVTNPARRGSAPDRPVEGDHLTR